jgi:hypothetical protein
VALLWLAISILGVWRVTHLLAVEDGPFDVIVRLRTAAGDGFWGGLLDCFNCLSLWVAFPFALATGASLGESMLLWPALSGGAILVEVLSAAPPPPAPFYEAPQPSVSDHGLLRR